MGIGSLVLAIFAPLAPDPARTVWITGFGAVAVWAGLMALPRFRSVGRKPSAIARTGVGLGIVTIAIMIYAWVALATASSGVRLPAPAHWIAEPTAVVLAPESAPVPATTSDAAPPSAGALDPAAGVEAERLALGRSLGSAAYVLDHTASADGLWPASLALTTDAATLMTPDGIVLTDIPPDTQVLYSVSSDRRDYSLTLIGPLGAAATVDSTTGVVETTAP